MKKLSVPQTTGKIPYSVSIIKGDGANLNTLFDGNTDTGWFPGWNAGEYPVKALVKLDSEYYLTKIRYYDWVGKPKLTVTAINGTKRTELLVRDLNGYGAWQEWEVSTSDKIQFLEIEISDIQGDRPITELEFYGSKDTKPNPVEPQITKFYGDALKIGVNGFHWIPKDLNPTPNMRMYQMLQWTWTATGLSVEPTFQADGNYDTYLRDALKKGQTVVLCPNKIPDWFANTEIGGEWSDQRLHKSGLNSTDPVSYKPVAAYAFQLAARYGSKVHPESTLVVNTTPRWNGDIVNKPKSGLNLLKYIEIENEPDRPWKTPLYKYTPEEYAALLSAVYDEIKKADPKMKVVMSGLSSINVDYLNKMLVWFKANRADKKFCADVINVHHYCNKKNPVDKPDIDLWEGAGVHPEQDNLQLRLSKLMTFVKTNIAWGTEVWFSEFGYDTVPASTVLSQYPKLYGTHTAEELQGQWLLRTYLYSIASGIDKAFMFNLCDENSAPSGYLFGSSGLLTSEADGYKKKQSWKDVDWLVRQLNNWKFYKDISINGVTILEFRSKLAQSKYFFWSPTANDTITKFKIGNTSLAATEKIQIYQINGFINPTDITPIDNNKKN